MTSGLVDADLGGGVVKKRIGRAHGGKRGGYRTLVATNHRNRWIFVFGFSKNAVANIGTDELVALRRISGELLALTSAGIQKAEGARELVRIDCDGTETIKDSCRGP